MIISEIYAIATLACGVLLLIALLALRQQQKENWLRLALTSMNDAILMPDTRGRVRSLNEVAVKLTGWSAKDAYGKPVSEILHIVDHDSRTVAENPISEVLASGRTVRLTRNVILIARDGSERPIDSNAAPARNGKRITGAVLIFRDITERYTAEQQLLESEERLKAVTNQVHIGLVMINRDRRYVYINNFYRQLLNISSTNILGKKVEEVIPVVYQQIRPNLDRAFVGERLSYEVKGTIDKEKGLGRIYSVTYEPQTRQSLVTHVVIVVVDITDMKRAAEALAKQDLQPTDRT